MPRKTNKKQTRLAWAPTTTSGDANDVQSDRFARLRYGHPNLGTVRHEMPRQTKAAATLTEASSSIATTSRREDPRVMESEHIKKENMEKKGDKIAKAEKKQKKKSKQKEPEEEGRLTDLSLSLSLSLQWYRLTPAKEVQIVQPKQESSSEDEIVAPGSLQRARRTANPDVAIMKPSKPTKSPRFLSRSPGNTISVDSSDEGEPDVVQPRRRLKRKAEPPLVVLGDSDDSEPVVSSPVKRRRRVSPAETPLATHVGANRSQQELEDDVKDLEDSGIFNVYAQHTCTAVPTNILQLSKKTARAGGLMSLQETRGLDLSRLCVGDALEKKKKAKRNRKTSQMTNYRDQAPRSSFSTHDAVTMKIAMLNRRLARTRTSTGTKMTSSSKTTSWEFLRRRSRSNSHDTHINSQRSTSGMSWHGWSTTASIQHSLVKIPCTKWRSRS